MFKKKKKLSWKKIPVNINPPTHPLLLIRGSWNPMSTCHLLETNSSVLFFSLFLIRWCVVSYVSQRGRSALTFPMLTCREPAGLLLSCTTYNLLSSSILLRRVVTWRKSVYRGFKSRGDLGMPASSTKTKLQQTWHVCSTGSFVLLTLDYL